MSDPHRPVYHLIPENNWMNDPNGLIQHNGMFHVFYQHNPHGALWGNMSWGHARSRDLIHWEHLPVAITPDPDGPDVDGCYSGVMVVHNGQPTMIYTGVRRPDELCCLAHPIDQDMVSWRKYAGNPVIPATPAEIATTMYRDHTLWREGDVWYMGVGAGIEDQGGAVLLYRSTDLIAWEYRHPLALEQPELNGGPLISTGWECPDYFFINDQPVLLACEWDGDPISSAWWRGTMTDYRFTATSRGLTDAGNCLYAPQTFNTEDDRRLFFGWLRELRPDADQIEAGWSGVMSLPREVTLRGDGTVGFRPASEVALLRGSRQGFPLKSGLVPTSAACEFRLESGDALTHGVTLRWGDALIVHWDGAKLHLTSGEHVMTGEVPGDVLYTFALSVFIDHSVVEVYLSDRIAMSSRVYVDESSWNECEISIDQGSSGQISVWQIGSIW